MKYEDILTFVLPYIIEREGLKKLPQVGNEDHEDIDFCADISTQESKQQENVRYVDERHII